MVLAHVTALEMAHDAEARQAAEVRMVKGLYRRGFSGEQIRQLYRIKEGMMDLPAQLAELAWKEIRDFEMEKNMPFITAAERYGLEKGLAEGRAEGRAEGLQEGLREARESLLAGIEEALEIKFGDSGRALLPEVRQLQELDQLRTILHAIKHSDVPESLRQLWKKA